MKNMNSGEEKISRNYNFITVTISKNQNRFFQKFKSLKPISENENDLFSGMITIIKIITAANGQRGAVWCESRCKA